MAGMFNYVDAYTVPQLEHQKMEYILQHVRSRLVEQRIARRCPPPPLPWYMRAGWPSISNL